MVRLNVDTLNFILKLSDEINKCYPGREQLIVEKTMNFKPKHMMSLPVGIVEKLHDTVHIKGSPTSNNQSPRHFIWVALPAFWQCDQG